MAALLQNLLSRVKVAVLSGGDWRQFEKQLLSNLRHDECLENLSLLPLVELSSTNTQALGEDLFRRFYCG
jgi:hypothetical protein